MRWIVGICILALLIILGMSYVAAPRETADFAVRFDTAFRFLRPVIILALFAAWFPLGRWLHARGRLSDERRVLWRKVWAPALIWYVLIEIGVGQGEPMWALGLAALYGAARFAVPRILPLPVPKPGTPAETSDER